MDREPTLAAQMIETNFTSHVTTLLAAAARMRAQGSGTIVVLSSVAAIRPRKANFVYGAAKAGLDAFARGLADSLAGSGVRVLLVRPGFVSGRMTAGMTAAPLASTPAQVGAAVAAALDGKATLVWVPRSLAGRGRGTAAGAQAAVAPNAPVTACLIPLSLCSYLPIGRQFVVLLGCRRRSSSDGAALHSLTRRS